MYICIEALAVSVHSAWRRLSHTQLFCNLILSFDNYYIVDIFRIVFVQPLYMVNPSTRLAKVDGINKQKHMHSALLSSGNFEISKNAVAL